MYVCGEYRDYTYIYIVYRTRFSVIPQVMPILVLEAKSLSGMELGMCGKLDDQRAPGVCQFPHLQHWDYKHAPPVLVTVISLARLALY